MWDGIAMEQINKSLIITIKITIHFHYGDIIRCVWSKYRVDGDRKKLDILHKIKWNSYFGMVVLINKTSTGDVLMEMVKLHAEK